jgi:hypothetical protein
MLQIVLFLLVVPARVQLVDLACNLAAVLKVISLEGTKD